MSSFLILFLLLRSTHLPETIIKALPGHQGKIFYCRYRRKTITWIGVFKMHIPRCKIIHTKSFLLFIFKFFSHSDYNTRRSWTTLYTVILGPLKLPKPQSPAFWKFIRPINTRVVIWFHRSNSAFHPIIGHVEICSAYNFDFHMALIPMLAPVL